MKVSAALPIHRKSLPITDEESGLVAAERALHSLGYKPERVVHENHFSIFAERSRISELAVYIVHASLLLIFFGTVVDGLWGWRGTLNLNVGQTSERRRIARWQHTNSSLRHSRRCRWPGKL